MINPLIFTVKNSLASSVTLAKKLETLTGRSANTTSQGLSFTLWDEEGIKDDTELVDLVVISIFGGVDTTRAQLGFAIALFADHPEQWEYLRRDIGLIPQAIDEIIRSRPTTTWATRQAIDTFELGGVDIRAGDLVHVFVSASGRDPQVVTDQDFDVRQKRKIHFGFGGGAHNCLGQHVARNDMSQALAEMVYKWRRIEWAGEAEYLPDSGNTSPLKLPIRPIWAD